MLRAGLLFWLVPITAAASGQTVAEDRTQVPMIEITEPGAVLFGVTRMAALLAAERLLSEMSLLPAVF